MSLKSIVPDIKLCQQLQPGDFPESALVWICNGVHDRTEKRILDRVFGECSMEFQAPTLEEILDEIQGINGIVFCYGGIIDKKRRIEDGQCSYPTKSDEALRLWMRLNGREVKG